MQILCIDFFWPTEAEKGSDMILSFLLGVQHFWWIQHSNFKEK